MKRLHIHVSVANLNDSIHFYTAMFSTQPTVIKSDYAKWMLDDPRVNFAISQRSTELGLNHLGIQVETAEELAEMHQRLETLQSELTEETNAACCYAKSDKYWVTDPQSIAWETFHTLDSIPVFGESHGAAADPSAFCVPLAKPAQPNSASCCMPPTNKTSSGACC